MSTSYGLAWQTVAVPEPSTLALLAAAGGAAMWQWLRRHGFNPEKKQSVEIANAENFLKWTLGQPWMVLHELAHSYHDRVLSYENGEIRQAYQQAVESKRYESVLHISGRSRRAYVLNNDQEYFAECSEAFFGTNDFYPFVRAELQQHDPNMCQLLKKLWKVDVLMPSDTIK